MYEVSTTIRALVMLSDILPTGFEYGVLNGRVKPGDTVAIFGAGPIGMAALLTARFYTPAEIIMIDTDQNRLGVAKTFGATQIINSENENVIERMNALTDNKGIDVAIEAVGVHCKSVSLHLETLWSKNITITTRLVDTVTTPMLFKTVRSGKLQPQKLITHRFRLDQIIEAYNTFRSCGN
jgi:alcohol dehydrogenase